VVAAQRISEILPAGEKMVAYSPGRHAVVAGSHFDFYRQFRHYLGALPVALNRAPVLFPLHPHTVRPDFAAGGKGRFAAQGAARGDNLLEPARGYSPLDRLFF
jgi:hypothetical protein